MDAEVFKTAIVGLGRNDTIAIHEIFSNIISGYQFEWVTADYPSIDLLLINSYFISSISIQKLINQQNVPYLIVDHQAVQPSVENDTLHLPIQENKSLISWLENNLSQNKSSLLLKPQFAPSETNHTKETNHTSQSIQDADQDVLKDSNLVSIFKKIDLLDSGLWMLFDQQKQLGIIDATKQIIWCSKSFNFESTTIKLPLTLNKTYAIDSNCVAHDLKQWLWKLAWYGEERCNFLSKHTMVSLSIWPPLNDKQNQKILLKACSRLKSRPSSAEQLAQKLDMPILEARKLVTTLVAVDFASITHHGSANSGHINTPSFTVETKASDAAEVGEVSLFRGFLSRLRGKLGI